MHWVVVCLSVQTKRVSIPPMSRLRNDKHFTVRSAEEGPVMENVPGYSCIPLPIFLMTCYKSDSPYIRWGVLVMDDVFRAQ